nr:glutaredoxin family protein [Comamonas composti]
MTNAALKLPAGLLAALILAVPALPSANAQTVYRHVGPDGRVTFSDRPERQDSASAPVAQPSSPGSAANDLPYALRQVVGRYPMTLYTGSDCSPCDQARQLLRNRGIPFNERLILTAADQAALQKISGDTSLPFATLGSQHLRGFGAQEWTQYLDAAGYPASSQLPPRYRAPSATPLTQPETRSVPKSAPVAPAAPANTAPPAASKPGSSKDNPAGLIF